MPPHRLPPHHHHPQKSKLQQRQTHSPERQKPWPRHSRSPCARLHRVAVLLIGSSNLKPAVFSNHMAFVQERIVSCKDVFHVTEN